MYETLLPCLPGGSFLPPHIQHSCCQHTGQPRQACYQLPQALTAPFSSNRDKTWPPASCPTSKGPPPHGAQQPTSAASCRVPVEWKHKKPRDFATVITCGSSSPLRPWARRRTLAAPSFKQARPCCTLHSYTCCSCLSRPNAAAAEPLPPSHRHTCLASACKQIGKKMGWYRGLGSTPGYTLTTHLVVLHRVRYRYTHRRQEEEQVATGGPLRLARGCCSLGSPPQWRPSMENKSLTAQGRLGCV